MFDVIWDLYHVDRFAPITSTQFPVYNSLYWDPKTTGIDALSQTDGKCEQLCERTIRFNPQMLQVIKQQQALATIIAPNWESLTWFRRLTSMSVDQPIRLTISRRTITVRPKQEPSKTKYLGETTVYRLVPRRAAEQATLSIAASTFKTYNSCV